MARRRPLASNIINPGWVPACRWTTSFIPRIAARVACPAQPLSDCEVAPGCHGSEMRHPDQHPGRFGGMRGEGHSRLNTSHTTWRREAMWSTNGASHGSFVCPSCWLSVRPVVLGSRPEQTRRRPLAPKRASRLGRGTELGAVAEHIARKSLR